MLALDEQAKLVAFLDQGKGLYIEGGDFAAHNFGTELFLKFGCNYVGNGNPYPIGNIDSVAGLTGSLAEGLSYAYLYQQDPDSYLDDISANGGTIFFQCQNNCGRAVAFAGTGNSYRAVYSAFIMGALRDGADTKAGLMAIYMNYLSGN